MDNFDKKINPLKDQIYKENKSIFDIITMASMLEKEAKNIEDKKIIAGSTPMLNPPLIIPIKNPIIDNGILNVKLSYKMGGDLESIKIKCL